MANNQGIQERSLTIEEKRQVLYAVLLRYATEAEPLRDVAMERVVLSALLGSTEQKPFRIGDILKNLRLGTSGPQFRIHNIQQILGRLIEQGKVDHTIHKTHHTYFLKPEAHEGLSRAIEAAAKLFDAAIKRLLRDSDHLIDFKIGSEICRNFISECFARFGKQIAKTVTGRLSHDDLARTIDAKAAFNAASKNKKLGSQGLVLWKQNSLMNVLSCCSVSAWQEKHNLSNCRMTNLAL